MENIKAEHNRVFFPTECLVEFYFSNRCSCLHFPSLEHTLGISIKRASFSPDCGCCAAPPLSQLSHISSQPSSSTSRLVSDVSSEASSPSRKSALWNRRPQMFLLNYKSISDRGLAFTLSLGLGPQICYWKTVQWRQAMSVNLRAQSLLSPTSICLSRIVSLSSTPNFRPSWNVHLISSYVVSSTSMAAQDPPTPPSVLPHPYMCCRRAVCTQTHTQHCSHPAKITVGRRKEPGVCIFSIFTSSWLPYHRQLSQWLSSASLHLSLYWALLTYF